MRSGVVLCCVYWMGAGGREGPSIHSHARITISNHPHTHSGGGILRLHSTFRHDMKIKASDEGRVMKTAAAFTKGT